MPSTQGRTKKLDKLPSNSATSELDPDQQVNSKGNKNGWKKAVTSKVVNQKIPHKRKKSGIATPSQDQEPSM